MWAGFAQNEVALMDSPDPAQPSAPSVLALRGDPV
jgi:hypothetical protein